MADARFQAFSGDIYFIVMVHKSVHVMCVWLLGDVLAKFLIVSKGLRLFRLEDRKTNPTLKS